MNDKEEILQAIQESISANMKNIREDIQKGNEEVSAKLTDFNNQISALKSDYEALKKDVEDMKAKKLEDDKADNSENSQDDEDKPLSQAELNKLAERNTTPSSPAAEDINTKENALGDALVNYALENKKYIMREDKNGRQ